MTRRVVTLVAIVLVVMGCGPAERREQRAGEAKVAPPAYMAGVESRVITSSKTGREYQVSVALPRGYNDSSNSYPVLYSLDANGEFGIVVETARLLRLERLIPEVVVVGIGYPVGHYFDAIGKRALDLTVTNRDAELREIFMKSGLGLPAPEGTGGAPDFLQFLRGELIPLIEVEYRVDARNRAIFGHSFGGLFAFYTLLHGQGAFQRFIIASPALWWDDRVSLRDEAAYAAANSSLNATVFFSAGVLETGLDSPASLRELLAVLPHRHYQGLAWTAHFFEDESHNSVVPASVSRGLRYVYAAR
jgi:hypothetical protein